MSRIRMLWSTMWLIWVLGWIFTTVDGIAYLYYWCSSTFALLIFTLLFCNNFERDGAQQYEQLYQLIQRNDDLESRISSSPTSEYAHSSGTTVENIPTRGPQQLTTATPNLNNEISPQPPPYFSLAGNAETSPPEYHRISAEN